MCLTFAKIDVNRGQENLDKVFYRWRLSLIYVAARCSDGLCPCFSLFKRKNYPARALPLTRQEVQTPWTPTLAYAR